MSKELFFLFLVVINLATFILYGIDKKRAQDKKWRISEKSLLLIALLGGAFGATAGMFFFRHKTRHWYFRLGLPLMALLWAGITWLVVK